MKKLSLALAASLSIAVPAVAGGPWISVELPANPYSSRGAFVVVHTYLHGTPAPFLVTGTAEGLVGGQRRTLPMTINSSGTGGTMNVMKTWPNEGVWVLKLGVDGTAMNAAIGVGTSGEVAFVRVPTTRNGAPRQLASSELESMLHALAAGQQPPLLASR